MTRHFIHLAYLGANFHGWQRQPHDTSVQQAIEEALAMYFRQEIPITGAGRTDAGVNASMMFAHCDLPEPLADDTAAVRALNSILGRDIAIYSITPTHPDAHARFDAVERTYRYFAHTVKDPFAGGLSWQASPKLDFEAMNEAGKILLDTSDFTSFSKLHTDVKTNICRVTEARWFPLDTPGHWCFQISADRFLRNMVRAVVGTLVEVGRGKLTLDDFRAVIDRRDRCAAGTSMPASPLFLHSVRYPYPVGRHK